MATKTLKLELRGTAPLMVKSDRSVDPDDPLVIEMKKIKDKRSKKTDADRRSLRRMEWEAGLYFDDEIGPYIPGWNVIRCIKDGALAIKNRKGRDIVRAVICDDRVPIEYDGPRDLEGMYAARMIDVRRVVNKGGGGSVMRARPKFDKWKLRVTVEFDDTVISRGDMLASVEAAGKYAGIGEFRPSAPSGGRFGRFEIAKVNGKAHAA